MKKEAKYKIGDIIYFKKSGQVITADVIAVKKGLFGFKYYGQWFVNCDIGGKYKTAGRIYNYQIIGKR